METNTKNSFQLDTFIYQTLEEAGTLMPNEEGFNEALSEQFKSQLLFQLGALIMSYIPDAYKEKLENMAEQSDMSGMRLLSEKYIDNFDEFVESNIREFGRKYVNEIKKLKNL